MPIRFTQYLRPKGQQEPVYIQRSQEVEAKAETLSTLGYRFECEVLRTGDVSLTIVHPHHAAEGDLAIELVPNGPSVPAAVDTLITKFHTKTLGSSDVPAMDPITAPEGE